ncbi:MAG: agmatinase [Centipeda sp. (in: firmicutes)]|uniref:agmatinase n=1 Tax=Selenomonas sp. oral taxon 920 TaxID=1884263 RepID=UPI000840EDD6|nr:agmatinase [Selenomonas sp. oral taxon 920]AOH48441.1 arginase [Selenomonas sp. oral taxon 920]
MQDKVNLPITGIASFAKYPIHTDLTTLDADIAVIGVPYDLGTAYMNGSKFGPRRIREVSCHYGRGDAGFYDPDYDEQLLAAPIRVVDCGDVDMVPTNVEESFANIEAAIRMILDRGALPAIMGGDHSITIPVARALDRFKDLVVIQFDAHLDWTYAAGGQKYTNGSPMRRMSEMEHVGKMFQIGIRGLGSSRRSDFEDAKKYGSTIITARQANKMSPDEVLALIPDGAQYYVTIDIDGYDLSIASGVGSPSPGGLTYNWETEVLEGIARKGEVVAFDMVEVAPQYDPTGVTPRVAAMTMLDFMGHIMLNRR